MKASATSHRLRLDLDHTDQLIGAVSALTLDPLKNIVFYIFPLLRAWSSNYVQIRSNDPSQSAMMPDDAKKRILEEIALLKTCAEIKRNITPYAALNYRFGSCGGSCSITSPALFIPHQHLFRIGKSPFVQEKEGEEFGVWNFNDNQTRFLICRELASIKKNNTMLRTVIKICIMAALFILYKLPFAWIGAALLLLTAIALYVIVERLFTSKMDLKGVEILAKRLHIRPIEAAQIAIGTLEKMRKQNQLKRKNWLCHLYITKSGDNLLDFYHRPLGKRIERLRKSESRAI